MSCIGPHILLSSSHTFKILHVVVGLIRIESKIWPGMGAFDCIFWWLCFSSCACLRSSCSWQMLPVHSPFCGLGYLEICKATRWPLPPLRHLPCHLFAGCFSMRGTSGLFWGEGCWSVNHTVCAGLPCRMTSSGMNHDVSLMYEEGGAAERDFQGHSLCWFCTRCQMAASAACPYMGSQSMGLWTGLGEL